MDNLAVFKGGRLAGWLSVWLAESVLNFSKTGLTAMSSGSCLIDDFGNSSNLAMFYYGFHLRKVNCYCYFHFTIRVICGETWVELMQSKINWAVLSRFQMEILTFYRLVVEIKIETKSFSIIFHQSIQYMQALAMIMRLIWKLILMRVFGQFLITRRFLLS